VSAARYYTGSPLLATRTSTTPTVIQYIGTDHQGTLNATLATTGAVTRQRYKPYGTQRGISNALPSERGYIGQVEDTSTGLSYLNARHYDPVNATFISVDPINMFNTLSLNAYLYGANDPIDMSDSSGLDPHHSADEDECSYYGRCAPKPKPAPTVPNPVAKSPPPTTGAAPVPGGWQPVTVIVSPGGPVEIDLTSIPATTALAISVRSVGFTGSTGRYNIEQFCKAPKGGTCLTSGWVLVKAQTAGITLPGTKAGANDAMDEDYVAAKGHVASNFGREVKEVIPGASSYRVVYSSGPNAILFALETISVIVESGKIAPKGILEGGSSLSSAGDGAPGSPPPRYRVTVWARREK
jgi:RHS repeat-associated protein